MSYELDILPVEQGSDSGDAILMRVGNLSGKREEQYVILIDAGFKGTGEEIENFIEQYYNHQKPFKLDLVILTHPDDDHSGGMPYVLENFNIGYLLMHRPELHLGGTSLSYSAFRTDIHRAALAEASKVSLERSLNTIDELESIISRNNIKVYEPFSDSIGLFSPLDGLEIRILGPSISYYEELLPNFRDYDAQRGMMIERVITATKESFVKLGDKFFRILENWGMETLQDPKDGTTPENNSSVITYIRYKTDQFMFTGDAGVPALMNAMEFMKSLQIDSQLLNFIQVPHHGSKRNVGPKLLNDLLGSVLVDNTTKNGSHVAYVSVSKNGEPEHPSRRVCNAFKRRGFKTYANRGLDLCKHSNDIKARSGWSAASCLPFYDEVEE